MTQRDKEIYDFIVQEVTTTGFYPSIRDIGVAIGLNSTSSVWTHFDKLRDLGLIEVHESKKRYKLTGYKLVKENGYGGEI